MSRLKRALAICLTPAPADGDDYGHDGGHGDDDDVVVVGLWLPVLLELRYDVGNFEYCTRADFASATSPP